ncbi:MAG: cell wall-active antibiotics response protein [Acidimicrobiia bacterium]|nr:cell wall-active antibiotics response protein [Acidimicrobiia bacterium]
MRTKLARVVLVLVVVQIILAVVGRVMSKRLGRGDERSDDFQVAAVFGAKKFHSRATSLKSGTVISSMGGVDLDLRDATLDPGGASLELKATMGGFQVTVPPDWAVDFDDDSVTGGLEVDVTPLEDLPADAPKLHIRAVAKMGGGKVTAGTRS